MHLMKLESLNNSNILKQRHHFRGGSATYNHVNFEFYNTQSYEEKNKRMRDFSRLNLRKVKRKR